MKRIAGTLAFILCAAGPVSADPAPPTPLPASFAQAAQNVVSRPQFRHGWFGLEVYSLDSGKPVFALNGDKLFIPASTTKLFTEGAALALLGPDYRFHTPLYRTGPVRHGTLEGNLILVGSGDPNISDRVQPDGSLAFADEDHSYGGPGSRLIGSDPIRILRDFAAKVRDAGITRVRGRVLVDVSLFPEDARDLGTGETISPIEVNDNAIDVVYRPGTAIGDPARLTISPGVPYIHFVNKIVTVAGDKSELEDPVTTGNPDGVQTVTLIGTVGVKSGPVIYGYPFANPSRYAATLLTDALEDAGVRVGGKPGTIADASATRKFYRPDLLIAEHVSQPLSEDARLTLKVSQNLHASTMPYVMGAVLGHATEKIDQKGFELERDFLVRAGLDLSGASQSDGAGGSVVALFTPDFVVHYLAYMARQPGFSRFESDLPILGRDGTLADVQKDSPAAGHVFAKTGTYGGRDYLNGREMLTGKGLAGYTTTRDGRHLAFAFYVNHVELSGEGDVSGMAGETLGELAAALYLLPLGEAPEGSR